MSMTLPLLGCLVGLQDSSTMDITASSLKLLVLNWGINCTCCSTTWITGMVWYDSLFSSFSFSSGTILTHHTALKLLVLWKNSPLDKKINKKKNHVTAMGVTSESCTTLSHLLILLLPIQCRSIQKAETCCQCWWVSFSPNHACYYVSVSIQFVFWWSLCMLAVISHTQHIYFKNLTSTCSESWSRASLISSSVQIKLDVN